MSELRELAAEVPKRVSFGAEVNEASSHLIEAGGGFFLMPSVFEPCGLNQMYSQVYGTLPVVSQLNQSVSVTGRSASC